MQPMLVMRASHAGILYLNGHFSGELSADEPLIRPVAPRGALYLDYRPLTSARASVARKLVFSGGRPMAQSIEEAENLSAVLWPSGICEIEITPDGLGEGHANRFSFDGRVFSLIGAPPKLYRDEYLLGELPEGASLPRARKMDAGYAFVGEADGGMYALLADEALQRGMGFLTADQIEIISGEALSTTIAANDFAGHTLRESWRFTKEGLMLLSSKASWAAGAARRAESAEETVLAAVQAILLGESAEAEPYFAEEFRFTEFAQALETQYALCTNMKYPHPDERSCVALLRLENERMAVAQPLYYRCKKIDGRNFIESAELPDARN